MLEVACQEARRGIAPKDAASPPRFSYGDALGIVADWFKKGKRRGKKSHKHERSVGSFPKGRWFPYLSRTQQKWWLRVRRYTRGCVFYEEINENGHK